MRSLSHQINQAKTSGSELPQHIAVVCDGNRRWARAAGFTDVSHGHRRGASKIIDMLTWCDALGIKHATVYLLSVENLMRDSEELELLLPIISDVVADICYHQHNWQVKIVGNLEILPEDTAKKISEAVGPTVERSGLNVNIAIGYGGRQEIIAATKSLVAQEIAAGKTGDQLLDAITIDALSDHLYTSGQPDPDLVIRTSGEQRLSGFLLWQSAYSEIWFTEAYWPAFRRLDFLRALRDYSLRKRRFGI